MHYHPGDGHTEAHETQPLPSDPGRPSVALLALAFVACTLIWGSTFLFISIGNDTVPPFWAATLRLFLASLILFAVLGIRRQAPSGGAAFRAAVGLGVFQFGLNFPLLYWAELTVPSSLTSIIFATIPLSSAVMARAMGLERLPPRKIIGALIAFGGVAAIFATEVRAAVPGVPMLAVGLATLCAVFGSMLYKRGPRQSAIGANAVATVVGGVMCLAVTAVSGEPMRPPAGWEAWFPLLYLTVAGSVGAFVLFSWLVNHMEVTRASYISVVAPIIALMLGVIVRGERLQVMSFVGSAIVLFGVSLGVLAPPPKVPATVEARMQSSPPR